MTILYAKEYNESPDNNRLVRKFKTGDYDAIYQMAMDMKSLINASMVLIPVPNRFGYPDATKVLCNVLKAYTGCAVMDILRENLNFSIAFLLRRLIAFPCQTPIY